MISFILNEKEVTTALPPGMVFLDFVRYNQHLMGTKIGCREGDCGACVVLTGELTGGKLIYRSMTSCLLPLGNLHGKHVVSIEGINLINDLNAIQRAMADEGASQCGFCTPGFVVSLAGFCLNEKNPSSEKAIAAIDGNICRCTGYKSIERAAHKITGILANKNGETTIPFLVSKKVLPEYFTNIESRLRELQAKPVAKNSVPKADGEPPNKSSVAIPIGGGTDLYVQKHDQLVQGNANFIFNTRQLKSIHKNGNRCFIGPSATVTDLLESELIRVAFPDFPQYARLISSTPIRNMATIGGNFINASPIGDFTVFFLALNAMVELTKPNEVTGNKIRTLPLRNLYTGYKKLNRDDDEIITKISFELPKAGSFFNFEKVSKRTHLDIASVNTAMQLATQNDEIVHAGLSAGGVAPVPLYLQKTSEYLVGKLVSENLIEEAITIMQTEISPISDARGSKAYKRLLLTQLVRAHFMQWMKRKDNNILVES